MELWLPLSFCIKVSESPKLGNTCIISTSEEKWYLNIQMQKSVTYYMWDSTILLVILQRILGQRVKHNSNISKLNYKQFLCKNKCQLNKRILHFSFPLLVAAPRLFPYHIHSLSTHTEHNIHCNTCYNMHSNIHCNTHCNTCCNTHTL